MEQKPHLKIIEKIRKLLALAASANEHEAALAAEKAQGLLAEHNLSMLDVGDTTSDMLIMIDSELETDSRPWRRNLATALSKLYFCEYFFTIKTIVRKRYDVHTFIGAEHNIAVAKMMFEYLNKTIDRLAREGSKNYPTNERAAYQVSFKNTCAIRVSNRIGQKWYESQRKTCGGPSNGLPVLYEKNEAILQAFIDSVFGEGFKIKNDTSRSTHAGGRHDGAVAGGNIGLDGQIGDAKGTSHLLEREGTHGNE